MSKKKSKIRNIKAFFYRLRRKKINQKLLIYLVMVAISSLFWFFIQSGNTVNTEANFQIEYYGLPQNNILVPGVTTNTIKILFSARGATLLSHHAGNTPIRIDLSKLDIRTMPESDSTLKFVTNDDIRSQVEIQMPYDYKFISLKPDTIKLDFGISLKKKVPISLITDISFEKQYRHQKEPTIKPDSITISGSAMLVDTINQIYTEPLKLRDINNTISQRVKLVLPEGVNTTLQSTEATIYTEKYTQNSLEIPITIINIPDTISLRIFSQNVTLKFNVGWHNYKKISKEMFTVVADFNDLIGIIRPELLPVRIAKMPENMGVSNIKIEPEAVEYLIEKKPSPQQNLQ